MNSGKRRKVLREESLAVIARQIGKSADQNGTWQFGILGLLAAFDRYPFRCSEQITSRSLPLLYLSDLAKDSPIAADPATDQKLREAIETLLTRQDSNGSFGLWSVGGDDVWLDSYVTDFLTRARERKVAVPETAFKPAAQHGGQHHGCEQERRHRSRLCTLCAGAQWRGADRRSSSPAS
jgi:uncharacterized protein YfaS (alpha-2-macroglobulin family)